MGDIAILIQDKYGMQAFELEESIPHRAFLAAMHWTFGTFGAVHTQRDDLRRLFIVHGVDPATGHLGQRVKNSHLRQHLRHHVDQAKGVIQLPIGLTNYC